MDKVLEPHKLPQLNHEKIENVNKSITTKKIESVIKKKPPKQIKHQGQITSLINSTKHLKKLMSIFLKLLQKKKKTRRHTSKFIL